MQNFQLVLSVEVNDSLIIYRFLLPSIRVFSNESVLRIKWPKYWSFSFNISPSNEYSGLISFRIDWFDQIASGLGKMQYNCHPKQTGFFFFLPFLPLRFLSAFALPSPPLVISSLPSFLLFTLSLSALSLVPFYPASLFPCLTPFFH